MRCYVCSVDDFWSEEKISIVTGLKIRTCKNCGFNINVKYWEAKVSPNTDVAIANSCPTCKGKGHIITDILSGSTKPCPQCTIIQEVLDCKPVTTEQQQQVPGIKKVAKDPFQQPAPWLIPIIKTSAKPSGISFKCTCGCEKYLILSDGTWICTSCRKIGFKK